MKNGLKKEDSALIYGIAILMMIYHHLFSIPEKLGNTDYFSILNNLLPPNTEQRFSWLLRLCVPFYSFISGYGICTIISKTPFQKRCSPSFIPQNYILTFKQILKLLKKYWIVFIIFLSFGVRFLNYSLIGPQTFIRSLFGLANDYNAEWWYIKQHMMMMLLFPLFDFLLCNIYSLIINNIFKKYRYGKHIILSFIILSGILFGLFRNAPFFTYLITQLDNGIFVFTIIFFEGFLCSFLHLFEISSNHNFFQKLKPALAFLILSTCCTIRYLRAYDATYCKYDAFITVPIIYSLVTLFSYAPKSISDFLRYLGKYSTYMWLTHTFFCYYYFSELILSAKISIFMFLLTTALSLVSAIILTALENALTKLWKKITNTLKKATT